MSVFKEKNSTYEVLLDNKCARRIKGYSGSLMMVEVYFDNYYVSEEHSHPHEQMTYCLEGEFEFYVGEDIERIYQGDTIYIPSDVSHYCKVLTQKGKLLDVFTPIRDDFIS